MDMNAIRLRYGRLDGLVHFTDVVTQSNNTHKSVPIILSAASAENYGVIYDEKSIVTAFKEAGFRTLVIANQKLTTSMIGLSTGRLIRLSI